MDGHQTAWHAFLRSDQLSGLTAEDREMLLAYGLSTVIDLRSPGETEKRPDSQELLESILYCHIPFMEADISPEGQAGALDSLQDLGSLYLSLLERKDVIRQLFRQMDEAPDGCILFHCTAGKDRTGVLALMLLMLAGVDRQDCETNYMQSFTNLTRNPQFAYLSQNGYHYLVRSDAEDIDKAYDHIASCPHGIKGFLEGCGISRACMERVCHRMLG